MYEFNDSHKDCTIHFVTDTDKYKSGVLVDKADWNDYYFLVVLPTGSKRTILIKPEQVIYVQPKLF